MHLYTKAQKLLSKIIPATAAISDEERERLLNYAILIWVSVPTAIAFGINALFFHEYLLFTLISLATGMQLFGWRMLRSGTYPESVFRLNFWFLALLLLYVTHTGGEGGSKALWLYTGPLIAFALLRTREASFSSLAVCIAAIAIMLTTQRATGELIYNQEFIVRFAVTYLIQVIATGSFNSLRHRYWREARRHHKALLIEKSRLDEEIIRRTRAEAELQQLASTDPLCNILNRRAFMQAAEKEMARHKRSGQALCLAILDVDHFKQINDRFGHPQGDVVLRSIAQRMACRIREGDHFGRIGGEEFAVLLVDTPLREGILLANRLRQCIEHQVFILNDIEYRATISIGISPIDLSGDSLGDALQHADRALYLAKHNGRNRVDSFEPGAIGQHALSIE